MKEMNDLWIAYDVEKACKANRILAFLKRIPLIKKIFRNVKYGNTEFKVILTVITLFSEFGKFILGKAVYFASLLGITAFCVDMHGDMDKAFQTLAGRYILLLYFFFTLIGAVLNNALFDVDEDRYNTVMMLRMDARTSTLFKYGSDRLKEFVGHLIILLIFTFITGNPWYYILLIPAFSVGVKLLMAGLEVKVWQKKRKYSSGILFGGIGVGYICIMLAAIVYFAASMQRIPDYVYVSVMIVTALAGTLSGISILRGYNDYRIAYKGCFQKTRMAMDEAVNVNKQRNSKAIVLDKDTVTGKSGFAGFNELFVKRHKKLLWRRTLIISLIIVGIYVVLAAALIFTNNFNGNSFRLSDKEISQMILTMVFICYIISSGESFTSALFMNCDHSMLTYSFYKEPGKILKLFKIRLIKIIEINAVPGILIGIGFALIICITGGTDNYLNYVAAVIAPIAICVFVAVHYLTIYYLLQPYNSNSELKNPAYSVIRSVTYLVSFFIWQSKISGMMFVVLVVAFCVIYCAVACALVYRYAPKTFRIHK